MTKWLIISVVLVVAGHYLFRAFRPRWEISVLIEDGQCLFRSGIAQRDRDAYESFFLREQWTVGDQNRGFPRQGAKAEASKFSDHRHDLISALGTSMGPDYSANHGTMEQ